MAYIAARPRFATLFGPTRKVLSNIRRLPINPSKSPKVINRGGSILFGLWGFQFKTLLNNLTDNLGKKDRSIFFGSRNWFPSMHIRYGMVQDLFPVWNAGLIGIVMGMNKLEVRTVFSSCKVDSCPTRMGFAPRFQCWKCLGLQREQWKRDISWMHLGLDLFWFKILWLSKIPFAASTWKCMDFRVGFESCLLPAMFDYLEGRTTERESHWLGGGPGT